MIDSSYGFNNLLKEVSLTLLRVTNTFQGLIRSSSRTSLPAKISAPRSKGHSDPSVTFTHPQRTLLTYLLLSQEQKLQGQ